MRRRENGQRGRPTSKSTGGSERMESSLVGNGRQADLKKTEGQGHEHLKGHCVEFKYYADGIHSGLTPPG